MLIVENTDTATCTLLNRSLTYLIFVMEDSETGTVKDIYNTHSHNHLRKIFFLMAIMFSDLEKQQILS